MYNQMSGHIEMLSELRGNEFDMKGIEKLRLLLGGERIG